MTNSNSLPLEGKTILEQFDFSKLTATLKKGYNGKSIKSIIPLEGTRAIEVITAKGSRGIRTFYQYGDIKQDANFQSFSFIMFQDPNGNLCETKKRATDKNLTACHNKAVSNFKDFLLKDIAIPLEHRVI